MTEVTREEIFQALFALAAETEWNVGTPSEPVTEKFKETSRRILLFSDVPEAQQPWLGQAEHGEGFTKETRQPYKRTFQAKWLIYHTVGKQPGTVPTIRNNLILDAVEEVFRPKPYDPGFLDERNTLSGLVHHCYIDGVIFKDPGDIDGQAMIVVPIKILIP